MKRVGVKGSRIPSSHFDLGFPTISSPLMSLLSYLSIAFLTVGLEHVQLY